MNVLLRARNLGVRREEKSVTLSLEIKLGEIHALIGPNGSFKTTALRTMAGLRFYEEGSLETQSSFCFVGYPHWQNMDLTVREALEFWSACYGRPTIDLAIEACELCDLLGRFIYQLSQGQRQRLSLARLFCGSFSLWIIDEPFSNLDEEWTKRVEKLMHQFQQRGGSILFSDHQITGRAFEYLPYILRIPM